jgi:hypothetical protein
VKYTYAALIATMHGHSLVSQRVCGDHGDTHKSCLNILFIMITKQQRCYETGRLCQDKVIQFEFVLKQIMQRTYPQVPFEYSIRNDYNTTAV